MRSGSAGTLDAESPLASATVSSLASATVSVGSVVSAAAPTAPNVTAMEAAKGPARWLPNM